MTAVMPQPRTLSHASAQTYARWFSCLAEPSRIRLLHAVATAPDGLTVGELTRLLGISQSTCSHHIRKLADTGFVQLGKVGTTTRVTVNPACCVGLPNAADIVMGLLDDDVQCCPPDVTVPPSVTIRAMHQSDWTAVRRIYSEGIASGLAAYETEVPERAALDAAWLPGHRWIAEADGEVIGWSAARTVPQLSDGAGVAETSVYVAGSHRRRGIGAALVRRLVTAADEAGLWMLQASIIAENRAAIAAHHASGFRTVGVRERIAQRNGIWHDMILLERRITR
jgi:L-amino acid N-acyltransferase YncA/DNA-binding transcriptional ArsR family regulator